MPDVTNELIEQIVEIDARGQAVPALRIQFRVGGQGPFSIELTKAEATKERIEEEQNKIVELVRGLDLG